MKNKYYTPKALFWPLIFFSLLLQVWRFGLWSAVRTIVGSLAAFVIIVTICLVGKQVNHNDCKGYIIRRVIGYTTLSGARGKPRQLFSLFVAYFGIGGIFNISLMFDSTEFFLTMFPLTIGLMGVTLPWVRQRCAAIT